MLVLYQSSEPIEPWENKKRTDRKLAKPGRVKMSECRRSLASRVLQGVTMRVESATRVQWDELRRLPKQFSSSSIAIGSEVILNIDLDLV